MTNKTDFPFKLHYALSSAADEKTPRLSHINHSVCVVEYVCSGGGYLQIDGQLFNPVKDSVYFLHKNSTHTYWHMPEDPWHKIFFVADGELMQEILRIYKLDKVFHIPDAKDLKHFFETFLRMNLNSERIHQKAAVIFHEFAEAGANHIYKMENTAPETIRQLREAIEQNIGQKFILADYCKQAGITTAYAVRAFHQAYGTSPVEYLLRLRLEKAQTPLRFSKFSIKEIAAHLNFSDQYHFSNFFKKRLGQSPSAYQHKWK